jgi:hypothetical protein
MPGVDTLADTARCLDIVGEDITGNAVRSIVGDLHGVILVPIRHDDEDPAKDFLAGKCHVRRHVGENGGAYEVAALELAPVDQGTVRGPLVTGVPDQRTDSVALELGSLALVDQ